MAEQEGRKLCSSRGRVAQLLAPHPIWRLQRRQKVDRKVRMKIAMGAEWSPLYRTL